MKSFINPKLMLASASSLLLITACQKQAPVNGKDKVADTHQSAQSTPVAMPQTPTAQSAVQVQSQPQPQPQPQPPTLTTTQPTATPEKPDLTQAHDINQDSDLSYLTALFLAKTTRALTDEEKLGLMSPEYYNENDSFKKRDLAAKLLPQINTTLEKYKGTYIAKIPVFDGQIEEAKLVQQLKSKHLSVFSSNAFSINTSIPYDFNTKSYTLSCNLDRFIAQDDYGRLAYFKGNKQNIRMRFAQTDSGNGQKQAPLPQEKCELSVPDEAMARKIEDAKTKRLLGSKGDLYVQITADNNELIATPIQANIAYLNSQTNEALATKELHW